MNTEQRSPIDLLNQMYTLAYWITGSLKKTNDLVYKTYEKLDSNPSVIVALKTFRDVCYEHFALDDTNGRQRPSCDHVRELKLVLRQQEMDRKLSVLFSEICGLKHRAISIIIGKPLDTIRLWLSTGRKSFAEGLVRLIALACLEPALLL